MVPKGWESGVIEDIAQVSSGGTPSRQKDSYWVNGSIPWVTTAEVKFNVITDTEQKITEEGLQNSSAKLYPKNTILMAMYGQGKTRGQVAKLGIEASTNQACAALQLHEGFDVDYYYQYLISQYENIRELANSGGQQNLSGGIVKGINIPIPPLLEQQKIAKILSTWDNAISTIERLIENSTQQKKSLVQQLLTGRKRLLNETGKRFESEWVRTELRKLLKEEGARNKGDKIQRVLSVTNHSGFVLPEEQFSKRVASKDTSNYKIVRKGQFGYNPSRINVGSFARLDEYEEGVLSPMYVVFSVLPKKLSSDYFYQWMHSHEAKQRINNSTQGSVRNSVNFSSLEAISLSVPNLEEQQKIATVLTNADKEIELLEQQLADLQQEKKALMQVLLTGKKRVVVDGES